jgi:hypothetical protein
MGPRAGPNTVEKGNIFFLYQESSSDSLAAHPVTRRYSDEPELTFAGSF